METANLKKKILIVEDEAPMLRVLSEAFARDGFEVIQSRDGSLALGMALKEKPDLILLDIILPTMDGLTLLKKLRENGEFGKMVPVILLTNLSADNEAINTAITENNPAYYLVKTEWTVNEVLEKARERLGMA